MSARGPANDKGEGSVVVIRATEAQPSDRNLRRLASRAIMGLGRTGSSATNGSGSGDYALAFSADDSVCRAFDAPKHSSTELANQDMSAVCASQRRCGGRGCLQLFIHGDHGRATSRAQDAARTLSWVR
ncbi:MAG: P1 family peptidase [Pseudoxanthomonas sp.]